MTSVSAGHIMLTPTQLVESGRPQRESNPGPPHQESRALPTELPRPLSRLAERTCSPGPILPFVTPAVVTSIPGPGQACAGRARALLPGSPLTGGGSPRKSNSPGSRKLCEALSKKKKKVYFINKN